MKVRQLLFVGAVAFGAAMGLVAPPPAMAGGGASAADEVALRGIVLDADSKPVAGAEVGAYSFFELARGLMRDAEIQDVGVPPPAAKATTGADGRFHIAGVERGRYVLRVVAAGRGIGVRTGAVAWDGGGPEIQVVMPEGVSVEGDVVDAARHGLANLPVSYGPAFGHGGGPFDSLLGRAVGTTDASGRFHLEGAPKRVPADGGEANIGSWSLHVETPIGNRLVRTFWGRMPPRLKVTVRGALSVDGVAAEAETGKPLAGAIATASVTEETDEATMASALIRSTVDAEGRFRLADLPPGDLSSIAVLAPGYGAWSWERGRSDSPPPTSGSPPHLDVHVPKGITVRGRVADGAGRPVAGTRVGEEFGSIAEVEAATGPDGRYEIRGVPRSSAQPGKFGPKGASLTLAVHAAGLVLDPAEASVRLEPDSAEVVHDLVLRPSRSIEGRVIDADGRPVAGATVWGEGRDENHPQVAGDVVTGTDGSFVLPGIAVDSLRVKAERPQRDGAGEMDVDLAVGEHKRGVDTRIAPPPPKAPPPPPPDVATLIARLKSADKDERGRAARDLYGRATEARDAVPALVALLRDEANAWQAAETLGKIGDIDDSALPAALRLLERDAATGLKVLRAMGRRAAPAVAAILRAIPSLGSHTEPAEAALVAIGLPAVPELVAALRGGGAKAQELAGAALRGIGADATTALLALAKDPDAGVRTRGIRAMNGLRRVKEAAWPVLAAALADGDRDVHLAALGALVEMDEDAAGVLPAVAKDLGASDENFRYEATRVLVAIGPAARVAVPKLLTLLADPVDGVRGYAIMALGRIGGAAAVEPLKELATRKDSGLHTLAIDALGEIGAPAKSALPILLAALDDADPSTRRHAVEALAAFGADARAATPRLLSLLRDSVDDSLRGACAETLGAVAEPKEALAALIPLLETEGSSVLSGATAAVRRMGMAAAPSLPTVLARLRKAERGSIFDLPSLARTLPVLGPEGHTAVPILVDRLTHEDPQFAPGWAAAVLLEMGAEAERAKPVALQVLSKPPINVPLLEVTAEVVGALNPPAKDALPALERLLEHFAPAVRRAAAAAIEKIRAR